MTPAERQRASRLRHSQHELAARNVELLGDVVIQLASIERLLVEMRDILWNIKGSWATHRELMARRYGAPDDEH